MFKHKFILLHYYSLYNSILGYGVFATKAAMKGQFLLQYPGEAIMLKEGEEREKKYPKDLGSYLFFYNKYW